LITSLSEEGKKQAETKYAMEKRGVYLFEYPKEEQLAQEMLNFHGVAASSLIVLSLKSGDQMIGTLALVTEGDVKFTQQHADLIDFLSEPFAIALSNTLKHRNELKLQDSDFFREVTMRICGNLEIEKGLNDCIKYLSQHMPADCLYLQRYEHELDSIRYIAKADTKKGEAMDLLITLPPDINALMIDLLKARMSDQLPPVLLFNNPQENPLSKFILEAIGKPFSSAMNLTLMFEGQRVGGLMLLAKGNNRFNEHHARLYEFLQVPFTIAMSNALKHRSLLKLYDRDFFWEATTRVCGNLEIEKGLSDCMKYLSQHMPADVIYLQRYEMELGAMRFIAKANAEKGEQLDLMISVPEMDKSAISEFFQAMAAGRHLPVAHFPHLFLF
jgi:transcriptional regulator with GAF, ATPase, and Fis domain